MTKTWRRVAEWFYWRGMSKQVKELVSRGYEFIIYVHFQLWLSSFVDNLPPLLTLGEVFSYLSAYE